MRKQDFAGLAAALTEAGNGHSSMSRVLSQAIGQIDRGFTLGRSIAEIATEAHLSEIADQIDELFPSERDAVVALLEALERAQAASVSMCHSLRVASVVAAAIAKGSGPGA